MASSSRSTQDRPLKNTPSISSSPSRRRVGKQPTTSTPLPGLFSPIIINPRTGGNLQFPTISSSHHVGLNHAPRGPGLPPPTIKSSKHAPAPSLATTKPGTHSSSTPVLPSTLNSTSLGTGEGKKAKVTLSETPENSHLPSHGEDTETPRNAHKPSEKIQEFLHIARDMQDGLFKRYRGPLGMSCSSCGHKHKQPAVYRCRECTRSPIYCKTCMVNSHQANPLHLVEEWSPVKGFWGRRTLGELGMVINLNHDGKSCDGWSNPPRDVQVGGRPEADHIQLLELGLWASSWKLGNITAQDFFRTLASQTDGVIPTSAKDRYRELLFATREYQFIKWCMRKGVQPSQALKTGSLATLCPACPHININMSPEWINRSEDKQYLDALYHAVDGNFTQNLKDKGTDQDDLPLTLGAAYFANENDAKEYFKTVPPPKKQSSSCSKFGAMGYYGHWGAVSGVLGLSCARHMFVLPGGGVDLKVGETWAAVDFLMLSGLQRWMKLKLHISAYDINCQYRIHFWKRMEDIRNLFWDGHASKLSSIQLYQFPSTRAAVGKFHEPAHKVDCRLLHSFHYLSGAAQTDGEAPERLWAVITFLALRTREMTPGGRHDTVNYFQDGMNWRRTYGIALFLVKKHLTAVKYERESETALAELEIEIKAIEAPADIIATWAEEKRRWDSELIMAGTAPTNVLTPHPLPSVQRCPYEPAKSKAATQQEILSSLQKRSVDGIFNGLDLFEIIREGIELQELRCSLAHQLSRSSTGFTDTQVAQIQENFSARVDTWSKSTQTHLGAAIAASISELPSVDQEHVPQQVQDQENRMSEMLLTQTEDSEDDEVDGDMQDEPKSQKSRKRKRPTPPKNEEQKPPGTKLSRKFLGELRTFEIHLPSSYPASVLKGAAMSQAIEIETAMRQSDADSALDEVKTYLAASYSLGLHQAKSTTQQLKLRNRGPARRQRAALHRAANAYRRARVALIALGMKETDPKYRPLKNDDLHAFLVREQDRQYGDSKNTRQSWIWGGLNFINNDTNLDPRVREHIIENFRVHWCKTKANAERWAEERELVAEEMTRTLRFFDFQVHVWQERADTMDKDHPGSAAYARKQVNTYSRLLDHSREQFAKYLPSAMTVKCTYSPGMADIDP